MSVDFLLQPFTSDNAYKLSLSGVNTIMSLRLKLATSSKIMRVKYGRIKLAIPACSYKWSKIMMLLVSVFLLRERERERERVSF